MLEDLLVPDEVLGIVDDDAPRRDPAAEGAVSYYWPAFLGLLIAFVAADVVRPMHRFLAFADGRVLRAALEIAGDLILLYFGLRLMRGYATKYSLSADDFGLSITDPLRLACAGVVTALVAVLAARAAVDGPWEWLGRLGRGVALLGRRGVIDWLVYFSLAAVVEEAVFRGFLFGVLSKRWGAFGTVVLTSALFSVAHQDPVRYFSEGFYLSAWSLLFRAYLGAVFGWLRVQTGSLAAPAAAHVAANVLLVVSGCEPSLFTVP